jgi:anaerobic selenocysteine-containing dehydrogenase
MDEALGSATKYYTPESLSFNNEPWYHNQLEGTASIGSGPVLAVILTLWCCMGTLMRFSTICTTNSYLALGFSVSKMKIVNHSARFPQR